MSSLRDLACSRSWRFIILIIGVTYILFQAELFDDEYKENHPAPVNCVSITKPALSCEIDKENAQETFALEPLPQIDQYHLLPAVIILVVVAGTSPDLVRDKSPPSSIFCNL